MTEAVIVAAARTPIGRARKGSLIDVDAFAWRRSRSVRPSSASGIDAADIDDIVLAESLQGGGDIARNVAVRLGLTAVPGLADNRHCAVRPERGADRRRQHPGRHGPGRRRRWHREPQHVAADVEGARAAAASRQMWMSPSHPETPDAPTFDMSITVGENTAREMGLTRHDVDEWARVQPRPAPRVDRLRAAFEEEIVPVEVHRPRRQRARCSPSTSTRAAARPWRRSPRSSRCTPSSTAPTVTAGNAPGLNDAAAAVVVDQRRLRRGPRPRARWRASCRGRRSASSRPAPAWARRSRSRRRSTAPA